MNTYSSEDGDVLVKAARYAIEIHLKSPRFDQTVMEKILDKYNEKRGVFVTIEHHPTMSLRGCIGYPRPTGQLGKMLVHAAIGAATGDERFVPISQRELQEVVVEVSILSEPKPIEKSTATGKKNDIKLGRDGLIINYGFKTGLLLPIVAVENKWDKERFIEELCMKAGLPPQSWKRPDVSLYRFTAQVFKEASPEGEVREVHLE